MKAFSLIFLFLILQNDCAFAQSCTTFDCAMQQAKTAFEAKDFRKAYDGFKAAKNFKNANADEANAWIDKTFDALEKQAAEAAKAAQKMVARKTASEGQFFSSVGLALTFHQGEQRYAFMNKNGRTITPFKYDVLSTFDNQGFAKGTVSIGNNHDVLYLIDTLGNDYLLATDIRQLDSNITALDLRKRALSAIPDVVCQHKQLKVLLLSHNQLSSLPACFSALTNLRILDFGFNHIRELPADFGRLTNLTNLDLTFNPIAELPKDFGQLTNLQELNLSSTPTYSVLKSLPVSFGQLTNLQNLHLFGNHLTSLPETFGQLTNLQSLQLGENELESLPANFGQLKNLRDLNLGGNKLTTLPANFGQLASLQTLEVGRLTSLPAGFGRLHNLQTLLLSNCPMTQLPEGFGQLAQLETFEMMHSQLTSLPQGFGQLTKLNYLCLFDGKLKTLPADIGQLANLRILNLNLNQLTSLPEEIGQLSTLDQLLLSSNQLTTLPTSICQLKTLKTLAFSENPIKKVPECVASMSAKPSIFETVEALAESDAPDSAYMLLAQKLLTSNYVAAYNSTLLSIEADSTDANLYFNLSFYALFVGDYKKSIEAAQKTLQLNPSAVKVETNLALGYLLDNQYDKAEAIYKKWKGKKFDTSDDHTANTIFLKDIDDLEGIGTQHKDFEKVKRLLLE